MLILALMGVRPTHLCRCPELGKLCGIGHECLRHALG